MPRHRLLAERELVRRIRRREERDFAYLLKRHHRNLVRIAGAP